MAASLVQDVWLGWEPRLRGRRLAPWEPPRVRLLFHLDAGSTLDDARVAPLLEALGARLDVVAWEPRLLGRSAAEVLDDARRLVAQGASGWNDLPLVVAGHGLGGWVALALAGSPAVVAAVALAPSLESAGPDPSSPLRAGLAAAFSRPPLLVPTLVLEGRDRPAAEAEAVSEWVAREPRASRVLAPGEDAAVLVPPWPDAVAAWAESAGTAARDEPA
jgi:alpha-beta hydrolase superfamily lysophospholipase